MNQPEPVDWEHVEEILRTSYVLTSKTTSLEQIKVLDLAWEADAARYMGLFRAALRTSLLP